MANHKHILLDNECKRDILFTPKSTPITGSSLPQIDDFIGHADALWADYDRAIRSVNEVFAGRANAQDGAAGYYMDIKLANADIAESALNSKTAGVQLMTFTPDEDEDSKKVTATVYVAKPKADWLPKKLNAYKTRTTPKSGKHWNEDIINRIEKIKASTILSLISDKTDRENYQLLLPEQTCYFEIWMSSDEVIRDSNVSKFPMLGITKIGDELKFTDSVVVLVKGTRSAMENIPYMLDEIQEVRLYHQPSILTACSEFEQHEWSGLIRSYTINRTHEGSVKVAILDTGVNNGHPLLEDYIDEDDCVKVLSLGDTSDHKGHGTQMTGLALYGDLAPIVDTAHAEVWHKAMSVKMIPGDDEKANDPDAYGPITERAVDVAREKGAKVCCMASTHDDYTGGAATSWSAAVDESLYNHGACDALMLISAGNVEEDVPEGADYRELCKTTPINSPAQSMNAITVGAYTEKVVALDNPYHATPLAKKGDISPYSRTSYAWAQSRIKPEIMMEGGNMAYAPLLRNLSYKDLSLVTTDANFNQTPFTSFYATSAATALATKLAAEIQTANPMLSALSIRALLIHSARWTEKMELYPLNDRLRMFGYGVPNPIKAIASQETNATFIYEGVLIPFEETESGGCRYHEMHHFQLPWPKQLLEQMADLPVTMRVTLSYYIQPSPGNKSYKSLYKYQSAGLAFDVKLPEETTESLIARHNQKQEVDFKSKNKTNRWTVGIENRKSSTVQCDWIENIAAAQLAECGEIVVYPTAGWWAKRKFEKIDNRIPYSLVVSIETQEQDIYTPIAQTVMVGV